MKDSEKRLLFLLLALLLAAGVVVLWKIYRDKKEVLESERKRLELQIVEIDELLKSQELWETRADWLDKHQPPFKNREQIDNLIFRDASADGVEGVTTSNIRLLNEVETPHYIQAGATLSATGTLEDVFRWLHALQRPEEFRVVSDLTVTPDKEDDTKITCKFSLLRWYATNQDE